MPETIKLFKRFYFDLIGGQDSLLFIEGRFKYILIVTDDFSRFKQAQALEKKTQVVKKLIQLVKSIKAQFRHFQPKVAYVYLDNVREQESDEFTAFLKAQGITLETSSLYILEQNGLAERANRIVIDILRLLLI